MRHIMYMLGGHLAFADIPACSCKPYYLTINISQHHTVAQIRDVHTVMSYKMHLYCRRTFCKNLRHAFCGQGSICLANELIHMPVQHLLACQPPKLCKT